MDILALLSEQVTPISLAIVIMWFYNKLVIDFLSERKEMIEALRTERKEWLAQNDRYLLQLFDTSSKNVEALQTVRNEVHSLRSTITEVMLRQGKATPKNE